MYPRKNSHHIFFEMVAVSIIYPVNAKRACKIRF